MRPRAMGIGAVGVSLRTCRPETEYLKNTNIWGGPGGGQGVNLRGNFSFIIGAVMTGLR